MFSKFFTTSKPTIAELEKHLAICVDQGRCRDVTELFEEAGRWGYGANECRDLLSKLSSQAGPHQRPFRRPSRVDTPPSISGPTGMRRLKGDKLVAAMQEAQGGAARPERHCSASVSRANASRGSASRATA